ncbi:MAG: hypothetical protein KDI19_13765, partial [Pseudomonadales bacterium]|nr:hypothetical protein [Pseudomonadales bacterium]
MKSETGDGDTGAPQGNADPVVSVNEASARPTVLIPDASLLLYGEYERDGFDLVITGPDGQTFVVHDYFGMVPPPNLVLANGAGLSPEMVQALLHLPFDGAMFAGPADGAPGLVVIGHVKLAIGTVTAKNGDETRTLKRGDPIYKGDDIRTGDRSFIKAEMDEGTKFQLGKNAHATVDDFSFQESTGQGHFAATVIVGGFHYQSGKIGSMHTGTNPHSQIRTPSAIIAIRGSELDGSVDPSGETIVVHQSSYLVVTDINGHNAVVLQVPGNTSVIV